MESDESGSRIRARTETLLVVDDDPKIHPLIEFHLDGVVERILHAESPVAGLQIARHTKPDVVLLDIDMPRMDGFELCRELKADEDTRDSQVLFLTGESQEHQIARALDSGAADYVTKPFNVVVLQARVRAALRTKRLVDLLRREARIDGLTGRPNRRAFEDALNQQWSQQQRKAENFATVVLDLDHFKSINDEYGHGVGDEVLRCVGTALQASQRAHEVWCRIGGEEFAALLRGVDSEHAVELVERMLAEIKKVQVRAGHGIVSVTASAGIANMSPESSTTEATRLLQIADDALYSAKTAGRACLVSVEVE